MLSNDQHYAAVIPQNTQRDTTSIPVLSAPFKTQQFTVEIYQVLDIHGLADPDVPFEVGETVTGGTSGATARVIAFDGVDQLILLPLSGTLQVAEVITGSNSGAQGTVDAVTTADFELLAITSNQELPPDPTKPVGPDNEYSTIGYTDESDQTYYSASTPFNPRSLTPDFFGIKKFNIETTAGRWIFVQLHRHTSGSLYSCNIDLFNNIV